MLRKTLMAAAVLAVLLHGNAAAPSEAKAESKVQISGMVVEIPETEMDKVKTVLGAEAFKTRIGPKGEGGEEGLTASIVPTEDLEALSKMLQTGEIQANMLWNPRVLAKDGQKATIEQSNGEIHYMEKVKENLYELKATEGPASQLTVTPTIKDGGIELAISLQVRSITGRAPLSEAPDLDAGPPLIGTRQVSSTVSLKDGQTMMLGGLKGKEAETLVFVTAGIVTE